MNPTEYHEFLDSGVEGDVLGVRPGFAGSVIIDGWNANNGHDAKATSIELDQADVLGLIDALVSVSKVDVFALIEALTGATFEVAA